MSGYSWVSVAKYVWLSVASRKSTNAWAAAGFGAVPQDAGAGHVDERAGIAAGEEVVADREAVALLGELAHQVVVVDEADLDLAGRDRGQDRVVALVDLGLVGLDALQPRLRRRRRP